MQYTGTFYISLVKLTAWHHPCSGQLWAAALAPGTARVPAGLGLSWKAT